MAWNLLKPSESHQNTFSVIERKQAIFVAFVLLWYKSITIGYFFPCCALSTRTTNFCSSIRNALTILDRTHFAHRDPPYARETVFLVFERVAKTFGRTDFTPRNFSLQSPHLGVVPAFLVCKYTNLPPGVFEILRLFDLVLYESLRRNTKRAMPLLYLFTLECTTP